MFAPDTSPSRLTRKLIDAGLHAHSSEAGLLALSGFAYLQGHRYADAEKALSAALAQGQDLRTAAGQPPDTTARH